MVAGKNDTRHTPDGYPAGCLQCLGSLVDEQRAELHSVQYVACRAYKRAGYDARLAEQLLSDANLQFRGTALQTVHLLMIALRTALALAAQLAYRLAYAPQLRIVGMRLEPPFVCERQHFVVHPRRIAYAQHVDAAVDEFLRNPVYCHIALRAHHHLALAHQRFVYRLDQRGGLSRSRRAVYHHHILCPQHLVHRLFLCRIEPREAHWGERERLGLMF